MSSRIAPREGELVPADLLDRIDIATRCLAQYRQLEPAIPWHETSERLRAELAEARWARRRQGDYLRLHVPGRFSVRVRREGDGVLIAWELVSAGHRRSRAA